MKIDTKKLILMDKWETTRSLFKKRLRRPFPQKNARRVFTFSQSQTIPLNWSSQEINIPKKSFLKNIKRFFCKKPKKETFSKEFKRPITTMLNNDIERLLKTFSLLEENTKLSLDPRFLDRLARDLKQLSHDAYWASKISSLKKKAKLIKHILETPQGAPVVTTVTFMEAVDRFSDQEPSQSDLFHLVQEGLKKNNLRKELLQLVLD